MDFLEYLAQTVTEIPCWIMLLKFPHIADPPDMVANPVLLDVLPGEFASAHFLTKLDRFEHRAITMAAPADVINLSHPWRAHESNECLHQIEAVDVVPHLLAFVAQNAIGPPADRDLHQVGEKSV